MLKSPECLQVLSSIPCAEMGTHLHGEQVTPEHEYDKLEFRNGLMMQCLYPMDIEAQKLKTLTELYFKAFGRMPFSFRAGRYAIGKYTAKWLKLLGYGVDSSVVPHSRFPHPTPFKGSLDFFGLPEQPYIISEDGNIWLEGTNPFLEMPITVMNKGSEMEGPMDPVWFRPGITTLRDLKRIVDLVYEQNQEGIKRPLIMMFHSMELSVGQSPYVKNKEDLRRFMGSLVQTVDYALDKGFLPRTVSQETQVLNNQANVSYDIISQKDLEELSHYHKIGRWFSWRYGMLENHGTYLRWIKQNINLDARVLSLGCGLGFSEIILARSGFKHIFGIDLDEKTINALLT